MAKVAFDFKNPDRAVVRHVVIQRLRDDRSWNQIDPTGEGFLPYVEMQSGQIAQFGYYADEVCWHLLTTGILAPGFNASNRKLPWFHLTTFGKLFVETGEWPLYDPSAYLARLAQRIPAPDRTVLAYLTESLRSFERGSFVAASVMLGIAAERVFLLLCDATLNALADSAEKKAFGELLERYQIKPKLDWLHMKFVQLQKKGPPGFPDNAGLMVTAIYDLLRSQRNDLGHPRDHPPSLPPEDVFASLQFFPRYFEAAEAVRRVLSNVKI